MVIVVDKAKPEVTGVSQMDLASQERGSALADSHKRPNRSKTEARTQS